MRVVEMIKNVLLCTPLTAECFFISTMKIQLKNIVQLSLVAMLTGLLVLSPLSFSVLQPEQEHIQIAEHCDNTSITSSFEQFLPPFLNNDGSGVRHVESAPSASSRIISESNELRAFHACQQAHQQLGVTHTRFLLRQSQREQQGFYLYELCKLLI